MMKTVEATAAHDSQSMYHEILRNRTPPCHGCHFGIECPSPCSAASQVLSVRNGQTRCPRGYLPLPHGVGGNHDTCLILAYLIRDVNAQVQKVSARLMKAASILRQAQDAYRYSSARVLTSRNYQELHGYCGCAFAADAPTLLPWMVVVILRHFLSKADIAYAVSLSCSAIRLTTHYTRRTLCA